MALLQLSNVSNERFFFSFLNISVLSAQFIACFLIAAQKKKKKTVCALCDYEYAYIPHGKLNFSHSISNFRFFWGSNSFPFRFRYCYGIKSEHRNRLGFLEVTFPCQTCDISNPNSRLQPQKLNIIHVLYSHYALSFHVWCRCETSDCTRIAKHSKSSDEGEHLLDQSYTHMMKRLHVLFRSSALD